MASNIKIEKQTFLENLLINPKYKILRHILVVFAISFISFNQTFIIFEEYIDVIGLKIYTISLVTLLLNFITGYFNLYVLIPQFLFKKRYFYYTLGLLISIFLLVLAQIALEYIVYLSLSLVPGKNSSLYLTKFVVLDNVSNFFLSMICISGVSMTVLLKSWTLENHRMHQLENKRIQSEVEYLKEQVNPVFLFNMLNRTGLLAKTEPEKASKMLMKLSQLLRYQLYDCSRSKVLLNSEITFLNNYLLLEQLYSNKFEYSITSNGAIERVLVPPLLFMPFVQHTVSSLKERVTKSNINLHFQIDKDKLSFSCNSAIEDSFEDICFQRIKERLRLLYKSAYSLDINQDINTNNTIISLQLSII